MAPGRAPGKQILAIQPEWLRGDNSPDADVDVKMHPLTLRFADRDLEKAFEEEYFTRTLIQVRWALIVGLLLYSVYGVVDTWLAPEHRYQIWVIRYLIVAPAILACLAFTFSRHFRKYRDPAISLAILVGLGGIVAMTSIIPQPTSSLYDVGLFMIIVYAFTLVRLSVPYAFSIAALTLAVYPLAALAVHQTAGPVVLSNLFFLFGMTVLGFFSNYSMGRYSRSNFLQRRLISLRTAELERKNSELMIKNQLLAESRAATLRSARRSEQMFSALSETLPGHILDEKYRIDGKIGSGGFGTVYRGEHILLHHPVAIKVFRPALGQEGADSMERFRTEGISACRVNHPNAVTVLDFDVSAGSLAYLVMELLHGHSLAQQLRVDGKLPQARAAEIACAVCDALTYAHAAGIIHRDIKPSNVFLHGTNGERVVKVIDFGIAKLTDESQAPDADSTTQSGMFLGTPAYMAPERVFQQPYDGRADVYAVGVMIYEMVSGRLPFERNIGGHLSLMRMHAVEVAPPLSKAVPDAHPKLVDAVTRAMGKDPAERPTAAQLGTMLKDLLGEIRTSSRARRASDLRGA
ncbi:MAG TPA: protein kinase [Gemmatimonadaceae bacterium]|nr:protein kinase [Gemmatimonadaceae bacterium]